MARRRVSFIITAKNKGFIKALEQSQRRLARFGRKMERMGRTLTRNITVPVGIAGGAAVKMASDFESSMSKIEGLVGLARDEVAGMRGDVLRLAGETSRAPQELADALFFVTSAGLRGAEAIEVLEASARASVAGLGETKTVADLVTSAVNAYGIENLSAAKATDILTAAVREGKAEAPELASSLGQVLPVASEMGVTFDQVGAAVAAMTRTGTDAQTAATQLRQILFKLLKPAAESEKAFRDMGTSGAELRRQLREEGLISVLGFLKDQMEDNEQAMAQAFPRVQALAGALDIMGSNADENRAIFERMTDVTGTADKAFDAAANTTEFKFNRALSNLKATSIELGEALLPMVNKLINAINSGISVFNSLSTQTKSWGLAITGALAAIGPMIWVVGKLIGGFAGLISIGTSLVTFFAGLSWPVVLGVAAVAGATALIINYWDDLKEAAKPLVSSISDTFEGLKGALGRAFDALKILLEALVGLWNTFGSNVVSIIKGTVTTFINILTIGLEGLSTVLDIWSMRWLTDWEGFLDDAKSSFQNVFGEEGALERIFTSWWNRFLQNDPLVQAGNWISSLFGLNGPLQKAANNAEKETQETADNLLDTAKNLANDIKDIDFSFDMFGFGASPATGGGSDGTKGQKSGGGSFSLPPMATASANFGLDPALVDTYVSGLEKMTLSVSKFKNIHQAALDSMKSGWDRFVDLSKEAGFDFVNFLSSKVAGAIASFSESLGQMFVGAGDEFATGLQQILLVVIDFAKQLAQLLIGIGTALQIIPGFGQAAGTPYIVAGAALMALASGAGAIIQKNIDARREREQSVSDALIRSDGSIVRLHPNDDILASQDMGNMLQPRMGGNMSVTVPVYLDNRQIALAQGEYKDNMRR